MRIFIWTTLHAPHRCTGAITEPIDILNRSLGFGGLILACTELWPAQSVDNLEGYRCDPQMREMLGAVTNGFVISSPNTTTTAWTDTTFKILSVIGDSLGVTDDNWKEHWYGGVVPWWFVQAVLTKFGGDVVVKTKDPVSVRLNVDEDWLDEEGYHIKADVAPATDLSVLTSSITYENQAEAVRTQNSADSDIRRIIDSHGNHNCLNSNVSFQKASGYQD